MRYQDQINGNLEILENSRIDGLVIGDVIVSEKISLTINGMIQGHLYLNEGSDVIVNGLVCGEVFIYKGKLFVYGRVMGAINNETKSFSNAETVLEF